MSKTHDLERAWGQERRGLMDRINELVERACKEEARVRELEAELKTTRATITEFMGRTAIAELTVERLYHELASSSDGSVVVKIFYVRGDEPFVFFINGAISIEGITEIEKECSENCSEMFEDGEGEYTFEAVYDGGDEHVRPYWDLEKLAFSPILATPTPGEGE